jgi:RNA polymerase sigma-70 factor (ECF subfamily)
MMREMDEASAQQSSPGRHSVATKQALLAFYRHAVGPAHRSAARLTGGDRQRAEDLVQQAFLELVREATAGRITSVDVGWVIVTVRHRYLDSLRRAQREERHLQLVAAEAGSDGDTGTERSVELLARLPDAQRAAVVLHHVDGLSVSEVAQALDRSVHATESLLARGRERLRRLLQEVSDE